MKLVLVSVLLVSLVLCSSFLQCAIAQQPPPPAPVPSYCDVKCQARCAEAGYQRRCLKYCGICCEECKCVPSGTYGNKSECPCYRDKLSSHGTPKCP
ncbi:Gibberellin regulated protein [Melia azedarach]|uniref:Gibberellin regulated protein n=1 Tax=Melia azedarach TaxID=155640 RepID=A0ACC1XTK5_MELAZ|nr:Gibberellin regulated protein [Melia azedarach]